MNADVRWHSRGCSENTGKLLTRSVSRNVVINYRARTVGMCLLALMLASLSDFRHDDPRWVLVGLLLIWPHVLYWIARRAKQGGQAETVNIWADSFLGGWLIAAFAFRLWPVTAMLVMGVINGLLFGGTRLMIQALGLCAIGLLIASLFFDIGVHLDTEPIPTAISIFAIFTYVGIVGATAYRFRLRQRNTKLDLEREEQKSQQLLLNVFPQAVIPRLKAGESPIADEFADVTVLFADIVGYTPLAERLGPRRTVMLLNDLFRRFDQAAAKFGVEKIETVGDGYLAVGGAPQRRDNHPEAVAALALAMVEASCQVPVSEREHVEIRVGIHTGPIFGGVVGEHRFHYAIFGETVNVASRIQNQSQPGRILVSESTYKRIRETFRLEECATLDLKGHGPIRTYWLLGLDEECRPNSGFQRDAPQAARA